MEEKDEPEEVIIKDQSVEIDRHNDLDNKENVEDEEEEEEDDTLLDLLDVREYLVLKKEGEEGPEIRGGPVDGLIVHASKANKNGMVILPFVGWKPSISSSECHNDPSLSSHY